MHHMSHPPLSYPPTTYEGDSGLVSAAFRSVHQPAELPSATYLATGQSIVLDRLQTAAPMLAAAK